MAKVFLSHSSKDKKLVREIAKKLGDSCSIDEFSFEAGNKTLDEIFRTMNISDIFVLFISETALESDWVKKEISLAKEMAMNDIIKIFPIIIDSSIKHNDPRIPTWLSYKYNLKYLSNSLLIYQKIKSAMREVNILNNPLNEKLENLFVGRNDLIANFESEINNIDDKIPTFVVAYSYYEGIGRRTFLQNALKKVNILKPFHSPFVISMDSSQSIESFIYKLNSTQGNKEIFTCDLSEISLEEKINIATDLVKEYNDANEIIFIEDIGAIILNNRSFADWFLSIVNNDCFKNRLVFCLISKNCPKKYNSYSNNWFLVYRIPEFSKDEIQNLFLSLLRIYSIDNLEKEEKNQFIKVFQGMPAQIYFAVNLLKDDYLFARNNIEEIKCYSDKSSNLLIEQIRNNELAYQILLLLAQDEIISLDIIYEIFGDTKDTEDAIQLLYYYSCFNYLQGGYNILKLNTTFADYIRRNRLELNKNYSSKYKNIIKESLSRNLDVLLEEDYTLFMLTIKEMLRNNIQIPKKYFIPSLIMKYIIIEYQRGEYTKVINLCNDLLRKTNFDEQIIWETKYRLTLAYARTNDSRFFESVEFFKTNNRFDFYFLNGFYYRYKGEFEKALEYYNKAIEISQDSPKPRREKVTVLLSLKKYKEALDLAKENYEQRKDNIYQVHSYFIALIRSKSLTESNKKILLRLINEAKQCKMKNTSEIVECMNGEYLYYVEKKILESIKLLQGLIENSENPIYVIKPLIEIYHDCGMNAAADELTKKLKKYY